MAAIIMDDIAMAMPIPILCSSDGGSGSFFVTLMYKGTINLSYNRMNVDVLIMSNANMLAGGIWKFEIVVFMAAPCSTKRESICMNTTEDKTVQNQIGSNLRMDFTSSTCVMVQRCHGFTGSTMSTGLIMAARSRYLLFRHLRRYEPHPIQTN